MNPLKYNEEHRYYPFNPTYKPNDEVRIPANSQEFYTVPGESLIYIEGTIVPTRKAGVAQAEAEAALTLEFETVNNAVAFLFDYIRYELNGVEIDRCKHVGITSTCKTYVTCTKEETKALKIGGWDSPITHGNSFFALIPLSALLGFAADYKGPIIRMRQELILVRTRTDKNAYIVTKNGDKFDVILTITNMYWYLPEIKFNLEPEKHILDKVKNNASFDISFRSFETHVYPQLPENNRETWKIMTTTNVEAPTHILIVCQTDRMDNDSKDASKFDNLNMRSVTVKLNNNTIPSETQNENFKAGRCLHFYHAYLKFLTEFSRGEKLCEPYLSYEQFLKDNTIFVIPCHYEEIIKPGTLDIQVNLEANDNFAKNTVVYAIFIHNVTYSYQSLTGIVKRV